MNEDVPQVPESQVDIIILSDLTSKKLWQAFHFKECPQAFLSEGVSDAEFFEKMDKLAADVELSKAARLTRTHIRTGSYGLSGSIRPKRKVPKTKHQRLFRFWELFPFILPARIKREAYEPAYNDLKEDFLLARRFKTRWAKRWLGFCFFFRTMFMIADCIVVALGSKIGRSLLVFFPESIRKFFGS